MITVRNTGVNTAEDNIFNDENVIYEVFDNLIISTKHIAAQIYPSQRFVGHYITHFLFQTN